MKKYLIAACLALFACTATPSNTSDGNNGNDGRNGNNGEDGQNGNDGHDGLNGTPGPAGAPGKDGTDNRIVRTWKCDFKSPFVSVPMQNFTCNGSIDFWYYASEMSSGDIFVRAGVDVYNPTRTNGVGNSSNELWPAGSWEANNGANWILLDLGCDNSTWVGNWEFLLNKNSNRLTVTYSDADVVGGKFSFDHYCQ